MTMTDTTNVNNRGKRNRKVLLGFDFKVDITESMPRRLVSFLLWCAKQWPGRFIPVNICARVVLQLTETPKLDSHHVKSMDSAKAGAKKILKAEYHSSLLSKRGVGVRAAFDDEDLAEHQYEADALNVIRSVERMDETRAAIRMSEIHKPELRSRVNRLSGVVKHLTDPSVIDKLRLPAPDDKKNSK